MQIVKVWGKITGITAILYVIFNVAVYYGQNIGMPLTDPMILGFEKWYWLLLQFGVVVAVGLVFPLAFPIFSWVLLFFEVRPVSDLILDVLFEKISILAYLFVTPAIFPTAIDGFLVQVAGLLIGMLLAQKIFPYSIKLVRRLM